jgi:phospho-N-acetylmuramoyl-pentapeptide-transferase
MINFFSYWLDIYVRLDSLEWFTTKIVLAFLTSLLICFISGSWIINQLSILQIKQYIRNEGPKSHMLKAGTPTMGGVIIIFSACSSTILWTDLTDPRILILLFSIISFGIIGFIDDYVMQIKQNNKGLKAGQKLLFQIIFGFIISYFIYFLPNFDTRIIVPFLKNEFLDLNWMYIPFATFIIVGTSNSVNLTDGLDGLAVGTVTIAKFMYMLIISFTVYLECCTYGEIINVFNSINLALYCSVLIGSGFGFLWFNSYPAQIFMGDIGSLSLGASLGITAILFKYEFLLVLIGGIFVIETLSVIFQIVFFKMSRGRRILKMAPIHHHFELKGLSETKIVFRFWIIGMVLVFISFLFLKF